MPAELTLQAHMGPLQLTQKHMNHARSLFCPQGLHNHSVITETGFIGQQKAPKRPPLIDAPGPIEPHLNGHDDLGHAPEKFDQLSPPEQVVLGMTFGINGIEEFKDDTITKRLGKRKCWVTWKCKRAIFKL